MSKKDDEYMKRVCDEIDLSDALDRIQEGYLLQDLLTEENEK